MTEKCRGCGNEYRCDDNCLLQRARAAEERNQLLETITLRLQEDLARLRSDFSKEKLGHAALRLRLDVLSKRWIAESPTAAQGWLIGAGVELQEVLDGEEAND